VLGPKASMEGPPRDGLQISAASARFVEQGHPWVIKDNQTGSVQGRKAGEVVDLWTPSGLWAARAILDPSSRIIARVLTRDKQVECDRAFFERRVRSALALRTNPPIPATMYRLINGESDGLPGLVMDRYGAYLVGQLYTPAAALLCEVAVAVLMATGQFRGVYIKDIPRDRRRFSGRQGRWLEGEPCTSALEEEENGVRLKVEPFDGLATGLFLDQRDNRKLIGELSEGMRVLNAFAYTGAFSVFCALQGARVDTLDLSSRYLNWARDNFELNGLEPSNHRFLEADAFVHLARSRASYDLVILDPPTFSTSRTKVWSPNRLTELYSLGISAVRPGGMLAVFSNYAGMEERAFMDALYVASRESRTSMRVLRLLQPGSDFPWLPGFPESRYFKGVLLQVG